MALYRLQWTGAQTCRVRHGFGRVVGRLVSRRNAVMFDLHGSCMARLAGDPGLPQQASNQVAEQASLEKELLINS
jgi:hypothetical protein